MIITHRSGWIITLFFVFIVVLFKLTALGLPCYWDEAFPYSYAINYQVENGIGLLPSTMPVDLSTGHPPLFYFLMALVVKATGGSIVLARVFPLVISALILIQVYRLGAKHFSVRVGLISVLFLATFSMFFVQSTFMLPETLLTLFVLLMVDARLSDKHFQYALFASMAILTKEPALVLVGILFLFDLKKLRSLELKKVVIILLPFIVAAFYFTVQKIQLGWFFYPRHLNAVSGGLDRFLGQFFFGYFSAVFIYGGQIFFSLLLLAGFVFALITKAAFVSEHKKKLILFLMFIVSYIAFSALNFYTAERYVLCITPFYFLVVAYVVELMFKSRPGFVFVLALLLSAVHVGYMINNKKPFDTSLGYVSRVEVQQQGINWLQSNNFRSRSIYAGFLLQHQLTSSAPGYVFKGSEFTQVSGDYHDQEILIFTDLENSPELKQTLKGYTLVKFFSKENAWMEVWEKK